MIKAIKGQLLGPQPKLSPLVTICIPFSRTTHPDWSISLASIVPPMNASHCIRRTIATPRGPARQFMAELAISSGSKYILCLDDDVTVPPGVIRDLMYVFQNAPDDVMVVGGIYCSKETPAMPLVFKEIGEGPFFKWHLGDVFECAVIATGMMLVKTEVFKYLAKPWFLDVDGVKEGKEQGLIPEDYSGHHFAATDDTYFCRKVTSSGGKVMAHGGVLGMHWDDVGNAYTLPIDSYPVKTEYEKRFGTEPVNEQEHWKRIVSIFKDYYGCIDILPTENEKLLEV